MGDLGEQTAVRGGDGAYTATLSRDWEIWGPMGGYVAACALRAAGAHSGRARPASLVGHFLGVADFADVDISARTLRGARRADSVHVSVTQEGRPVFDAFVWGVDDELPALEHSFSSPPAEAGEPTDHPTVAEHVARLGLELDPPYPFWNNLEARPLRWIDDWEGRRPADPWWSQWVRFVPTPDTSDPWVDAARLLVLVDIGSWPAVVEHHVDTRGLYAPSIDLACHFHRLRPASDWLLVLGTSPSGADGLVTSHQSVWADDGTFLASGIGQLLCRPLR